MCIVCTNEYDQNTTEIMCSRHVTEIPLLPKLTDLYCSNTKVTEIPLLPKLTDVWCSNTEIKYLSHIYKDINIYSDNIKFYNDYQLRKLQKNYRKRQFLKIIDMLPMHTNISRYLVLPEMLK